MSLTKYAETLKKLPSWLYKIGAQTYYDKDYPRHLFIETTATCQLVCSYCPRERVKEDMDYELFKSIVREASMFGPRSFSLHLFGEPLLWEHLIKGIRFIKSLNDKHTVLLTTNGILLNDYIYALYHSKVDEIIWTWRTEASFDKGTLRMLRHADRNGWMRFRPRLIKEITPEIEFQRWSKWPNAEVKSLHNYGGEIDLSKWNVPPAETRYPCYHLWFAPAVAWNGDILLCCADSHRKEKVGNFSHISVSKAWKSMEGRRRDHLAGRYNGVCKGCDVWKTYPDLFFDFQKRG